MTKYLVRWEIDIETEDKGDAAIIALKIQRDPNSTATCFKIIDMDKGGLSDIEVDLTGPEPEVKQFKRG